MSNNVEYEKAWLKCEKVVKSAFPSDRGLHVLLANGDSHYFVVEETNINETELLVEVENPYQIGDRTWVTVPSECRARVAVPTSALVI